MTTDSLKKLVLGLLATFIALLCAAIVKGVFYPAPPERHDLLTRWHGGNLEIAGSDGRWLVTHLENLSNHTIAKLPDPIFVVESGGISLSPSNLAKLTWTIPAGPFENPLVLETVPPPSTNSPIHALYIPMSRSKFVN
ncbi:MAG TPA: hypothetical protein VM680_06265 [Verrucomicrobiae bacterium]|nr:hypothetical protein [Verrucomicrobiae bacterium]